MSIRKLKAEGLSAPGLFKLDDHEVLLCVNKGYWDDRLKEILAKKEKQLVVLKKFLRN